MRRAARSRLSPWIESLILSWDSPEEEGGGSSGQLKAHVISVGQMSQSQAQGSEGPTGLLFLSDGVIHIPAVLTASAWEHLQEQEDRECFTSLVNTTVCVQDYRLQFHMAHEQTKCRFFLSVGQLATTAAGPVKHNTPPCTTLPSVRLKICKTWRALLGQEDSQKSQCGFDLSELLGEWQHDCLQTVLEDVRVRLVAANGRPVSPQPSTCPATGWDVDRVRYKGAKSFCVPVKRLLIPEEDAQQLQTSTKRDSPQVCRPTDATQPSVDDAGESTANPAAAERVRHAAESSPLPAKDSVLHEDMITGTVDRYLSNPWDIFSPPLVISSSSEVSPEVTPNLTQHSPTAAQSPPDPAAVSTSTQLPVHSSKDSSYFPPYQKQLSSLRNTTPSSAPSPPPPPASDELCTHTAPPHLPTSHQDGEDVEDTIERKCKKAKRKRSESTSEAFPALAEEEEEQLGRSPPSWLFDSQTGSCRTEESSSVTLTAGTVPRQPPGTHSDGRPFSYSYEVSGQNLQDLSRFTVAASLLHWAVKYLVAPKQTDNPPSAV